MSLNSFFNEDYTFFDVNNNFYFKLNSPASNLIVKIWTEDGIKNNFMNYQYSANLNKTLNLIDSVKVQKEMHLTSNIIHYPDKMFFQYKSQPYNSGKYNIHNYMNFYKGGTKYFYDKLNRLIEVVNQERFDDLIYQEYKIGVTYEDNSIKYDLINTSYIYCFINNKISQVLVYNKKSNHIQESVKYYYDNLNRIIKIEEYTGDNLFEIEEDDEDLIVYEIPKLAFITTFNYENLINSNQKVSITTTDIEENKTFEDKIVLVDFENKILKTEILNENNQIYYTYNYNYDYDFNGNWIRLEIIRKYKSETERKYKIVERSIIY
ncbi:MAG: hypothetical protein RLZZ540_1008 [Bacteroidota bacterium]|jgi:hypothetical protein